MQIRKLAEAFENQFFNNIQQMEALEMGVRQSMTRSTSQLSTITDGAAGQCNTFDGNQLEENGKPKRTFENMTIHRQYMEYNAIKQRVLGGVKCVKWLAVTLITIGVLLLFYLVISMFVSPITQEPASMAAVQGIVFSAESVMVDEDGDYAVYIVLFKMFSLFKTICFLVLGTYIFNFRKSIKIDTFLQTKKVSYLLMYAFLINVVLYTAAIVVYLIVVDLVPKDSSAGADSDISSDVTLVKLLTAVLILGFAGAECSLFYWTHVRVQNTTEDMLKFHDYLIQYRLTPRSRILRKHLPKMTMVLEEESCMDTSSMMMS